MSAHKKNSREIFSTSILVNTVLFVVLLYFMTIHRFAVNQAVGDDFDAILSFLNQYTLAKPVDQFFLVVQQHNEHRILLTRLAALIDLKIFEQINFVHLIWIGNLGWLMAIIGFWIFSKKYLANLAEFAPAAIVLLCFSHFEMMTWAMTSISQYWQVCFSVFAIGLMLAHRFLYSQFFYIAALFTSGGGIALAPIFSAYYFLQKKWRAFWINLALTGTLIATYFLLLPYKAPPSSRILEALSQPQLLIGYFLGFIGGLGNHYDFGISTILICGSILFLLFLIRSKSMYQSTPFLWWTVMYILITALLAALNRSVLGIASSGDSRYSEFSLLLAACLYVSSLSSVSSPTMRKKMVWLGFLISVVIYTYWYEQSKRPLLDRRFWLENDMQTHPNWPAAQEIKRRSIELGIVKP
jgi:hypothetical protein